MPDASELELLRIPPTGTKRGFLVSGLVLLPIETFRNVYVGGSYKGKQHSSHFTE